MTQVLSFRVEVYDCTVFVIIADDINEVIREYLEKSGETLEREVKGFAFRPDDLNIVYLFFQRDVLDVRLFNHEKSHLIDFILEDRELPLTDECRAWLDGWVSKAINDLFKQHNVVIKD